MRSRATGLLYKTFQVSLVKPGSRADAPLEGGALDWNTAAPQSPFWASAAPGSLSKVAEGMHPTHIIDSNLNSSFFHI